MEISGSFKAKSPSGEGAATFTTPAQEHQAARRRGVLTDKIKNVSGVAQSLNSDMVGELSRIDTFLGPFMGKLGDIVGVYETEKSCLERGLLEQLDTAKSTLVDDIIKSKASARQYSEIVQEHFAKSTALIREGFQNRRNLEAAFNEQMLDVVRGEYEDIIASMRAEDRKKLHFDRLENHKKLESCRIAVRIDMAAMLLQQRANLERQRKEEVAKMTEDMRIAREDNDSKLVQMRLNMSEAKHEASNARLELKLTSEKMRSEIEGLQNEVSIQTTKVKNLVQSNKYLEDEMRKVSAGYEAAVEAREMLEESFKEDLEDAKRKFQEKEEQLSLRLSMSEDKVAAQHQQIRELEKSFAASEKEKKSLQRWKEEFGSMHEAAEVKHAEQVKEMEGEIERQGGEIASQSARLMEMEAEISEFGAEMDKKEAAHVAAGIEREAQFQRKYAEVLEDVRKAKAATADLQTNVMVWLYDEIALRSGQEVDMQFDGTEQMAQQAKGVFKSAEQNDLRALYKIVNFKIAGKYAVGPDRALVSRMEDFKQEKSSMGQIFASDSLQIEGEVGGSAPVARGGTTAGGGVAEQKDIRDNGLANDSDAEFDDDLDTALDISRGRGGGVPRGVSKEQVEKEVKSAVEAITSKYEAKVQSLNAEWRAKCISLAQRLDKTEKEMSFARPEDVETIRTLESQVRSLVAALEDSARVSNASAPLPPAHGGSSRATSFRGGQSPTGAMLPKRDSISSTRGVGGKGVLSRSGSQTSSKA